MNRYVCLLRGVNVGGKNRLPMNELRGLFESLGYQAVETLIQSGNVVFSWSRAPEPAALETAIERAFGMRVPAVVRSGSQLVRAVAANPYSNRSPEAVHLGFCGGRPSASVLKGLDGRPFGPDEFTVRGTEVYLHLPNGMARTKLVPYLDRRLGVALTVRNWRTVTRLVELTGR